MIQQLKPLPASAQDFADAGVGHGPVYKPFPLLSPPVLRYQCVRRIAMSDTAMANLPCWNRQLLMTWEAQCGRVTANVRENCVYNQPNSRIQRVVEYVIIIQKQVRQQDAYLAIRPAYPRGCCPRAAKRIRKLHTLLVSLYF